MDGGHFRSDGTPRGTTPPVDVKRGDGRFNYYPTNLYSSKELTAPRPRAAMSSEKRPLDSDEASWTPALSRKLQKKAKHRLAKGLGTLQECRAVYGAGARAESLPDYAALTMGNSSAFDGQLPAAKPSLLGI